MTDYVVVDEIRKVVEKVSIEMLETLQAIDPNISGVHYEHGHPIEIIETLREKDKTNKFKFDRYPLIGLFEDFPENEDVGIGLQSEVTLHIIIAMVTKPEYKATVRYERNFKPILLPIYASFKKHLVKSKAFRFAGSKPKGLKINRLYWGREGLLKNESNIFEDWIDCIEVKKIQIKVNQKNC